MDGDGGGQGGGRWDLLQIITIPVILEVLLSGGKCREILTSVKDKGKARQCNSNSIMGVRWKGYQSS
ncbi:hypothetical protein T4E_9469 [Trichinella pseudospiralis]|uniref:Uncharacterized protein n=1 Tax=Trichinella pseudospiralis TaxID=6337 RepID=A0A0V0XL46_TRIPS|nr:hypothetical protein T4E_9469 [Trichinella pseudospiralis]